MAVTLGPSGITFSDGNTQNTAASAGAKAEGTFTDFTTSANVTMPSNSVGILVTMGGGGNGGGGGGRFGGGGDGYGKGGGKGRGRGRR